jgi:hypothetical protein
MVKVFIVFCAVADPAPASIAAPAAAEATVNSLRESVSRDKRVKVFR